MREIDIIIDGRRADIYRDENVTLDFNSSILGDISSIKCSASKTIRLPKTLNNDAIFDLAHMPSRDSDKARKMLSCEMYADGVAVFSRGLCHLLSSDGDHYEIAVTFGIMHAGFEQWLKDKPKLRDMEDGKYDWIDWKASAGVTTWLAGISQDEQMEGMPSMWYARYDCGVNDTAKINIHPCVTLREVYARVMKQNALSMNMPQSVVEDMAHRAIVLKNNNTSLNTLTDTLTIKTKPSQIWERLYSDRYKRLYLDIDSESFDSVSSTFLQRGVKRVTLNFTTINLVFYYGSVVGTAGLQEFLPSVKTSPSDYALVLEDANGEKTQINPTISGDTLIYAIYKTFTFDVYDGEDNVGKPLLKAYITLKRWEGLPDGVWEKPNSPYYVIGTTQYWNNYSLRDTFHLTGNISTTYQENNDGYPMDRFTLAENLPDITQIDFINFLCKFYGMFPMQQGDSVDFVPFSRLYDNIDANIIYDWSERLVESYPYYPNSVGLTLDGYAQRNIVTYKEDKNDPIDLTASLVVDDESLENERKFFEFPFAASRGDIIPQYSLNDEGELEKNDVEYRIMRITYGENYENNALKFTDDMKCQQILNRHYSEFQEVIRKPMQIEEDVALSLLELQTIDYSRPVYLSKYGRYFAIISIQWQSDQPTSRVKFLRIK